MGSTPGGIVFGGNSQDSRYQVLFLFNPLRDVSIVEDGFAGDWEEEMEVIMITSRHCQLSNVVTE